MNLLTRRTHVGYSFAVGKNDKRQDEGLITMMKDTITIIESNYDLVAALAACFNVDLDVQAEYDDMLEIDVTGVDIAEFVAAVNAL